MTCVYSRQQPLGSAGGSSPRSLVLVERLPSMLESFEARDAAALCGGVAPLLVPFSSSSSSRSFRFFLPFLVGVPFGFDAAASSTSSTPSSIPTNGETAGGRTLRRHQHDGKLNVVVVLVRDDARILVAVLSAALWLGAAGRAAGPEPLQHSPSLGANRSELPFFRRPEEVGFLAGWDGLVGRGAAIAQSSMSIVERVDVRARDTARRRAMRQSGCGGRSAVCPGFRPLLGRRGRQMSWVGRSTARRQARQTHSDGIQTLAPHTFSRRTTTLSLSSLLLTPARPSASDSLRAAASLPALPSSSSPSPSCSP